MPIILVVIANPSERYVSVDNTYLKPGLLQAGFFVFVFFTIKVCCMMCLMTPKNELIFPFEN